MNTIITREIKKFFEKDEIGLDTAEAYFTQRIGETVRSFLAACYEKKDAELLADKVGRKEAGLVVERRGDPRQVVTQLGVVSYHRTYYACREGSYCHPYCSVQLDPFSHTPSRSCLIDTPFQISCYHRMHFLSQSKMKGFPDFLYQIV